MAAESNENSNPQEVAKRAWGSLTSSMKTFGSFMGEKAVETGGHLKTFGTFVGEKASTAGTVISEKATETGSFISVKAKEIDTKTGFSGGVVAAHNFTAEKWKTFDDSYDVSKNTNLAVSKIKTGTLGGVGNLRSSFRLWSPDLRFFDSNRLNSNLMFDRFDKDLDGRLSEEELTLLLTIMFQWFQTQYGAQHYIPSKESLQTDVENSRMTYYQKINFDPNNPFIDKGTFANSWISFFSDLESANVTFRGMEPELDLEQEELL